MTAMSSPAAAPYPPSYQTGRTPVYIPSVTTIGTESTTAGRSLVGPSRTVLIAAGLAVLLGIIVLGGRR